jgi:EmrB/QacA subfamily drug resistance transporter
MPRKWWVLVSVACGTFMATLDSSIVNIALPTLTKSLGTDLYRIKWVVIVYFLVITCLLLPFGRLSDQYGRRRTFLTGFVIFTIGSGFCSISSSLSALIWFRALQAVGASMLMANGPAIIATSFPASERGTALGVMAMAASAGLISGPSIGGLLIGSLGWKSIFWANIPIGLVGIWLAYTNLARDSQHRSKAPFDWIGAFLQLFLLLALIVLFDPPNISISGSLPVQVPRWGLGVFALIVGAMFIKVESEAKAPLFDLSLLANRTFWTANLASFLTFVSFSSVSVLMPFFLEEVLRFPPQTAGIFMTAIPLTIFVVAPLAGRMSNRMSQELSIVGSLIAALVLFAMSGVFGLGIHNEISNGSIVLVLSLMGLALGLFQTPNNNAIMEVVPHSKVSAASALLATVRNLGMVMGTGLATSLFAWRMENSGDFVSALHFSHFVAGVIAVGAMLASLGKIRRSSPANAAVERLPVERINIERGDS